MKQVLFVGQNPDTVDFSDPALPPGFNADKIRIGIEVGMKKMRDRGWLADECMILPNEKGREQLKHQLKSKNYDCVVVGAGLRLPPNSLLLFEIVVNCIHQAAPNAAIAFNKSPEDTADAAARWLASIDS